MATAEAAPVNDQIAVTVKEAFLFYTTKNPLFTASGCLVCKVALEECCLNCRTSGGTEEQCAVVRGRCDHVFHEHCIKNWSEQHKNCPVCFQRWKVKSHIKRA